MDHKIAIAGAVAALIAGAAAAQAAPSQQAPAVPAVSSGAVEPGAGLQKVQFSLQFGVRPDYRHHRHSSDWYRRHGFMWDGDRGWVTRDYYDRHHRRDRDDYYDDYYRR